MMLRWISEEPAEIVLDRWGIPHIRAATRHDVYFVQGFNAARARGRQIDTWRKRGLGRLAAARLYVLLDGRPSVAEFERLAQGLIDAGVDVLQLRDKQLAEMLPSTKGLL